MDNKFYVVCRRIIEVTVTLLSLLLFITYISSTVVAAEPGEVAIELLGSIAWESNIAEHDLDPTFEHREQGEEATHTPSYSGCGNGAGCILLKVTAQNASEPSHQDQLYTVFSPERGHYLTPPLRPPRKSFIYA